MLIEDTVLTDSLSSSDSQATPHSHGKIGAKSGCIETITTATTALDSFQPFFIKGRYVSWLDVYFAKTQSNIHLLSEEYIRRNYDVMPIFLLHAMYAITESKCIAQEVVLKGGEFHYSECKRLYESSNSNPSIMNICATFLMAIYRLNDSRYMTGGMCILSVSIRNALNFGTLKFQDREFENTKNTFDIVHTKRLKQMLMLSLYEKDVSTSYIKRLPMVLPHTFDPALCKYVPGSQTYTAFYESRLWCYSLKILQLCAKVLVFIQAKVAQSDLQLAQLDSELTAWFETLPVWMKNNDRYCNDISSQFPPPYYIGYYISVYYNLRILIHRSRFLDSIKINDLETSSTAIKVCHRSASEITKIYMSFGRKPDFVPFISNFACHPIYMAGAIHRILALQTKSIESDWKADFSCEILDYYRVYVHRGAEPYYQNLIEIRKCTEFAISDFQGL